MRKKPVDHRIELVHMNRLVSLLLLICFILAFSGCSLRKSSSGSSEISSDDTSGSRQPPVSESTENTDGTTVESSQAPVTGASDTSSGNDNSDGGDRSEDNWVKDNSWVFVDNSWLNIRKGPSTEHPVIMEVYFGQALKRVAVSDYWSEIILPDGRTGFAYNTYLSLQPVE